MDIEDSWLEEAYENNNGCAVEEELCICTCRACGWPLDDSGSCDNYDCDLFDDWSAARQMYADLRHGG